MNRKEMRQQIFVYSVVFSLLIYVIGSCANTSTPPAGGAKDTIPPVLLRVLPDSATRMFPVKGGSIELIFDEYVVLKNAPKEIIMSPPSETNILVTKIRGRSVVVSFSDTLKKETTYSISFGESISDNNEGNPFPSYTYIFSTGNTIDSMLCTGRVLDAVTLLPLSGIKAALYTDHSDSAIYNRLPAAIAKTDSSGYFIIRNIPEKSYKVYAFEDNNNNNKYDTGNELIAFLDTLYTPVRVIDNVMSKIVQAEDTDTTFNREQETDIVLLLFKEEPYNQYVKENRLIGEREVLIVLNAPNTNLVSAMFEGIDSSATLHQFNARRDTLHLWIKGSEIMPDTLTLSLEYYKTDSLRQLSPAMERFHFPSLITKDSLLATKDSLPEMAINIVATPATIEREGFLLLFDTPLDNIIQDSIKLESVDLRGETTPISFKLKEDPLSLLKYNIFPSATLQKGEGYILTIPAKTFTDIYGVVNTEMEMKLSLPSDPKLTSITLELSGIENPYIIDLMDTKLTTVLEHSHILPGDDQKLLFPYLQPGDYSIRIVNDVNGNGLIDTGNLSEKRQPERIVIYTLTDGSTVISVSESIEVEQSINLKELFK